MNFIYKFLISLEIILSFIALYFAYLWYLSPNSNMLEPKTVLTLTLIGIIGFFIKYIPTSTDKNLNNQMLEDSHNLTKRIETMHTIENFNKELYKTIDTKLIPTSSIIDLNTIHESIKINPLLDTAIIELLNYYEKLAIGISIGIYDEFIIREIHMGNMIRRCNNFKNYISYKRQAQNSSLWMQYEALVYKWGRRDKAK